MSTVLRTEKRDGEKPSVMRTIYPTISKVALRCRGTITATSGREVAPPPSIVMFDLPVESSDTPGPSRARTVRWRTDNSSDGGPAREVDWVGLIASVPSGARLLLSGRNALQYGKLDKLLLEADRRGLNVSVDTTGSRLEELAPVLYGLDVDTVALSLYGPEDIHNGVTGSNCAFEDAVRGALALKVLSSETPRPALVVRIDISPENHFRLVEAVECAVAIGADKVSIRHKRPQACGDGELEGSAAMDIEALRDSLREIRRRWRYGDVRFYPNLTDDEVEKFYNGTSGPFGPNRCFAPWRSITVQETGHVRLCPAASVGDLGGSTLADAFNREPARNLRRALRAGLQAECLSCVRRFADEDQVR